MTDNSRNERNLIGLMCAYTRGLSGGDVWFAEVMRRLDHFEKTIVTSPDGAKMCRDLGLTSCRLVEVGSVSLRGSVLREYLLRTLQAILRLRAKRMTAVYASSDFFPDVLPAYVMTVRNPSVFWIQKVHHLVPRRRLGAWAIQKVSICLVRSRANLVLANSSELANCLVRSGIQRHRVKVCIPGVDVPTGRTSEGRPDKNRHAVYLGRIHMAKGIEDLIDIWAKVVAKVPGAHLSLIGNGEEDFLENMRSRVREKGIDEQVSFLGFLAKDEALSVVRSSRVFLTASREEGYGMAVGESLAMGTPVVCWDIPAFRQAFRDLIIGVELDDECAFVDSIVRILVDDDYSKQLSVKLFQSPSLISWDEAVRREQDVIDEALERYTWR